MGCVNVRALRGQTYQTGQTEPKECATNQAAEQPSRANNRGLEMSLDESATGNLSAYRQSLGVCWIAYGIFRLILGIGLIVYTGTATVMFGALLGRVPDAFGLMADFHIFYAVMVVLSFVCGILGLLGGLALLANQGLARRLVLFAAVLSISDLPFGTTLGTFTLIALLPLRGRSAGARA
jgi:hypothetical protein